MFSGARASSGSEQMEGPSPEPVASGMVRDSEPKRPTPPALPFGRTPRRVYVLVVLVGLAAVLATFSAVTPWYVESGTVPGPTIVTTFQVAFTPGPGGYISSCSTFLTAHYSDCTAVGTTYGAGNGTDLLAGLYLGLLGGAAAVAVLAFGGVVVMGSAAAGSLRIRKAHYLLITLTLAAIIIGAATMLTMGALQGAALGDSGACAGFTTALTPCNSLFGHANGIGCSGGSCAETDLSWNPAIGWYLALGAIGLLEGALLLLRSQALGAPCPSCGGLNRFHAKFCDVCGNPVRRSGTE
jgi:hypothetical protein